MVKVLNNLSNRGLKPLQPLTPSGCATAVEPPNPSQKPTDEQQAEVQGIRHGQIICLPQLVLLKNQVFCELKKLSELKLL